MIQGEPPRGLPACFARFDLVNDNEKAAHKRGLSRLVN
jgi:hypothetical protein